jgi:hypothetical protein
MPLPPDGQPGAGDPRASGSSAPDDASVTGPPPGAVVEPGAGDGNATSGADVAGGSEKPPDQSGPPSVTGALPPSPPDYKAVARISTQAVLESIELAFVHADVERGISVPADWTERARTTSTASGELDRDALKLVVYCGFVTVWAPDLEADGPAPAPKDAAVDLHARYRLAYSLKDLGEVQDGDVNHFAWTNGMLHTWPYWREIAQSLTLRMGLAPLLIGTFKLPWTGDPGRQKKAPAVEETPAEPAAANETDGARSEG